MKKEIIYTLDELPAVAQAVKESLEGCTVITLSGPLGAGKTTLVRELLSLWGVQDPVTSPTFTYLNQYENSSGKRFYHFDLYRIKMVADFQAAGFDEYLYEPDSIAFIEWPEPIEALFGPGRCYISIDYEQVDKRVLRLYKGVKG